MHKPRTMFNNPRESEILKSFLDFDGSFPENTRIEFKTGPSGARQWRLVHPGSATDFMLVQKTSDAYLEDLFESWSESAANAA